MFRPALAPPRVTGYTQITHDGQPKNFVGPTGPIVLTDGPRLYVQENINGRYVVVQVSASGGETVPIPTPFAHAALNNISPDKSELVVGSFTGMELYQPLWALPVLGGSPRRFGDLPGEDGTWMANGDLLISHGNELTAISNGGGQRKFATLPETVFSSYWLRWSPDGRVLRFTVADLVNYSIWEASADGGNVHRLLSEWRGAIAPQTGNWTPDGKYFVFTAFRNGRFDLWAMREKDDPLHRVSHEPVQLTAGPLGFLAPQPSADDKKIFVVGEQPRAELVRYDAKSRQFVPYLGGISAVGVSFSRDGRWVAYTSYPEGELWRSRIDGTEKLQLSKAPLYAAQPSWSPDGRQIAFFSFDPTKMQQLYLVSADGGTPREMDVGEFQVARVSWAPDGNSIDFGDFSSPENALIRSVDLKTLKVSTLPESQKLQLPLRSPDGRYLVATSLDGQKLMLFDFAAQKWSELAPGDVGYTQWSADSKFVYFDTGTSRDPTIYRVGIADHKRERVASLQGFRRVVNAWTAWSGLTPDGSPLLMRDIGSQEVYALDFEVP